MYGTVMIGKLRTTSSEQLTAALDEWERERKAPGHLDTRLLATTQGQVVLAVRFESQAAYEKLADSPAQDEWWNAVLRPLLADEPVWIDGEWSDIEVAEPTTASQNGR